MKFFPNGSIDKSILVQVMAFGVVRLQAMQTNNANLLSTEPLEQTAVNFESNTMIFKKSILKLSDGHICKLLVMLFRPQCVTTSTVM